MNITAVKSDTANVLVTARIESADIEKNINKIAKQLAKTQSVDGFRKGKVPIVVIKRIYGDKLQKEAKDDIISEIIEEAKKELDIKTKDIIGEPIFKKYEEVDGKLDIELSISLQPTIEAEDYHKLAPEYSEPIVDDKEVEERINRLLDENVQYKELKEKRPLAKGDQANFDFIGKLNGVEFDGGRAEGYELVIGSGQFVADFEEQMIGMNIGDSKEISVTFPDNYQSKDLAGKKVVFTVKLNGIRIKDEPELDDEMLKILFPDKDDVNVDTVKVEIKNQIKSEKVAQLYHEELKPKFMEALVAKYNFDLPDNIVEQEIDAQVNQKAQSMTEEELSEYQNSSEKINELRESLREDAINSVKATFLVDALAKKEKIVVDDHEVTRAIYYEALMRNQDPQEIMKYYRDNNLLPAVKMSMIEDKLFTKILELNK